MLMWAAALAIAAQAAGAPPPTLGEVLQRARAAVLRYVQEAAVILADEQCTQRLFTAALQANPAPSGQRSYATEQADSRAQRTWKAEMALVRTPETSGSGYPWMEFRDVASVDGKALPGREQRLAQLFLHQSEWTIQKARELGAESARYNLGPVSRNVNTPAVPLMVLHAVNEARFTFARSGDELVDRVQAWKVDFRERRKPYLIGGDAPDACASVGTFWIDPATGDVLRAVLQCGDARQALSRLTVSYERDAKTTLRLPAIMLDRAETSGGRVWVEGKCSYSNYRRFETSGRLVVPK
jgi:hypothetical protein